MIIENQHHAQRSDLVVGEHQLLRNLIDSLPDGIYIKDKESRFIIGNTAVAALMGVKSPEELIGKTDFDFFSHELASKYYADEQMVMRTNQSLVNNEEPTFDFRTGEEGWLLTSKVVWRNQNGDVVGIIGIGRDITELKQAQQEIEQAQRELEYRVQDRTLELSNAKTKLERSVKLYSSTLEHIRSAIQHNGINAELLMVVDQAQKQFERMS